MSQVFISYKRDEISFAELLESKLQEAGFSVWMDRQIRGGTDWREGIDEAIRRSIALTLIITSAAKTSEYVTNEWAFAYAAGVRVIPLMFIEPEELHPRLKTLQYRDFRSAHPWSQLIDDLRYAESCQLIVHQAVWGPKDKMNNVTRGVKQTVSTGRLDLTANVEVLGDPARGERKKLIVVYSTGGKIDCEEVEEDGRLSLPKSD